MEIRTGKEIFDELVNIDYNEVNTRPNPEENQTWQDLEIATQAFRWVAIDELIESLENIESYPPQSRQVLLKKLIEDLKFNGGDKNGNKQKTR